MPRARRIPGKTRKIDPLKCVKVARRRDFFIALPANRCLWFGHLGIAALGQALRLPFGLLVLLGGLPTTSGAGRRRAPHYKEFS
jgi:hypothetical protein